MFACKKSASRQPRKSPPRFFAMPKIVPENELHSHLICSPATSKHSEGIKGENKFVRSGRLTTRQESAERPTSARSAAARVTKSTAFGAEYRYGQVRQFGPTIVNSTKIRRKNLLNTSKYGEIRQFFKRSRTREHLLATVKIITASKAA